VQLEDYFDFQSLHFLPAQGVGDFVVVRGHVEAVNDQFYLARRVGLQGSAHGGPE
jgi:hypothetical protein